MLDKMWGEKFTDLTRLLLHSGNAFRHQTLGDVVVMWIIERRYHTFLIRVVCLDFMPWHDVDVIILHSLIFDYDLVTIINIVKEYFWKALDILYMQFVEKKLLKWQNLF